MEESEDAGARLATVLEGARKSVTLRRVAPEPVQIVREAPLVGFQAVYTTQGKEVAIGHLKAAVHSRFGASGFCVHDEVGYLKTFRQVSNSFFETLEVNPQDEATYHEVQLVTVNGAPAGFEITRLIPGQEASVYVQLHLTMLQRGETEIYFSDSVKVLTLDKRGSVLEGRFVENENGRTTLDLTLKRDSGSKYAYTGELQGKKLQGAVTSKAQDGWSGPQVTARELKRRVTAGKPFTWVIESYDPERDPTRFQEYQFRRAAGDAPDSVHVKASHFEMAGKVDEAGLMEKGEATFGPVTLLAKRAFKRGSL